MLRDTLILQIDQVRFIQLDGTNLAYDTEPASIEITQEGVGIEALSDNIWQVYPNPAQDRLIIKNKRSAQRQSQIRLYNLQGKLV
ncbi:MAG: T9SS type A sorting domain-containing protein, partial [Bacteroidota bacterium]